MLDVILGMNAESEISSRERLAKYWGESERSVHAYIFSAVGDFHDAQDVLQQVAMTVARHFDEYDETRPFVAWALWLAKFKIIDYYRKRTRDRLVYSEKVLDQIADEIVQQQPGRSARLVALEHCVAKLPAKSRKMIELRYFEEIPVEAVAETMHSTGGSVRVMLFRIRELLANCIRAQLTQEANNL